MVALKTVLVNIQQPIAAYGFETVERSLFLHERVRVPSVEADTCEQTIRCPQQVGKKEKHNDDAGPRKHAFWEGTLVLVNPVTLLAGTVPERLANKDRDCVNAKQHRQQRDRDKQAEQSLCRWQL
jgi:hypothetical protein